MCTGGDEAGCERGWSWELLDRGGDLEQQLFERRLLERKREGLFLRQVLAGAVVVVGVGGQCMATTGRAHDGAFARSRQLE